MSNVILFTDSWNKDLIKTIRSKVDRNSLEIFRDIGNFSTRVSRIPRQVDILVLQVNNQSQLSKLVTLKDYFNDLRILLILPDFEKNTISKGQLLRPRFIESTDSDYSNLGAVLEKMLKIKQITYMEENHGTAGIRHESY